MKVPNLGTAENTVVDRQKFSAIGPALVQAPKATGTGALAIGKSLEQAFSTGQDIVKSEAKAYVERDKVAQEATKKANALLTAQADTDFESHITSTLVGDSKSGKAGFLSLQGLNASAAAADTLDSIDKRQTEIADSLPASARNDWLKKSDDRKLAAHRQLEVHSAREVKQAEASTAKALADSTLNGLYTLDNSPGAQELAGKQAQQVASRIEALSDSPEDAKAKVADWYQKVSLTGISAKLASDDVEGASAMLESTKHLLGDKLPQAQHIIGMASKAKSEDEVKANVADWTTAIGKKATGPDGYIDKTAADAQLEKIPAKYREAVQVQLDRAKTDSDKRRKDDTSVVFNRLKGLWNTNGNNFETLPSADLVRLNSLDPDLYAKLQADTLHAAKVHKASVGGHASQAASNRAQRDLDAKAGLVFLNLPTVEERANANLDELLAGMKVSSTKLEQLKKEQNRYSEAIGRGEGTALNRINSTFEKRLHPLTTGKKKIDSDTADAARDEFQAQLGEFQTQNKRLPNTQETDTMMSGVLANQAQAGAEAGTKRGIDSVARGMVAPSAGAPKRRVVKNNKTGENFYLNADGTMEKVK